MYYSVTFTFDVYDIGKPDGDSGLIWRITVCGGALKEEKRLCFFCSVINGNTGKVTIVCWIGAF